MQCPYCKSPMIEEYRDFTAEVKGEEVLIEDVPTLVCEQCDHFVVDTAVAETIEDMLFGLEEGIDDETKQFEITELNEDD